ncbi:MAG: hypothetical protein AAFN93_17805, partial [Bacteroidota bacterium]
PTTVSNDYTIALELWNNHKSSKMEKKEFDRIEKQWQYLNEPPLGHYADFEFRLTEIPTFGKGTTIRVFLKDSVATFMMREVGKNWIVINKQFRSQNYWNQFNEKLETLFWQQPTHSLEPVTISDGTSYYFEGITPDRKYSIYRHPGSEYSKLISQFYLPLIIQFRCGSAQKKKLDCS